MFYILSTDRKDVLEQITGVMYIEYSRKDVLEQITGVPYNEYRP